MAMKYPWNLSPLMFNKRKDSFIFFLFSSHPNNMNNEKHEWHQQMQMLLKSNPNMAPGYEKVLQTLTTSFPK